jgi:hypothetical protein
MPKEKARKATTKVMDSDITTVRAILLIRGTGFTENDPYVKTIARAIVEGNPTAITFITDCVKEMDYDKRLFKLFARKVLTRVAKQETELDTKTRKFLDDVTEMLKNSSGVTELKARIDITFSDMLETAGEIQKIRFKQLKRKAENF